MPFSTAVILNSRFVGHIPIANSSLLRSYKIRMETTVESLPNEVIFRIFSFLGQSDLMACFNVCKNRNAVVLELDSWKEEKLTLQNCHDLKFLQMIFQKLPEDLALLELTRSQLFMSSNKFTSLEFNFPKLRILDLSFTDITCQNLLHAISKLDLSKLLLRGCSNVADPFFSLLKKHPLLEDHIWSIFK